MATARQIYEVDLLGTAYVMGFQYALKKKYKFVLAMDADLSHDPSNIPIMIDLMKDYDLVIGSRYVKDGGMVNWGMGRFLISKFANGFLKMVLICIVLIMYYRVGELYGGASKMEQFKFLRRGGNDILISTPVCF